MKALLKIFLFSLSSLWLTAKIIDGFKITGGMETYLASGVALAIIYFFVRPILRLFFLPINLLSLGLLSWVINVAILYLLTLVIPQIKISPWQFAGFSYQGFVIPPYYFSQIATFIVVSLVLSFIINFLGWLCR